MLNAPLARRGFVHMNTKHQEKRNATRHASAPTHNSGDQTEAKSAVFGDKNVDCRFVIVDQQRIQVGKYVVLPVDVHHFVEELLEFSG